MNLTREQRKALNEKVIYLIDSGSEDQAGITGEDIGLCGEADVHTAIFEHLQAVYLLAGDVYKRQQEN